MFKPQVEQAVQALGESVSNFGLAQLRVEQAVQACNYKPPY